MNYEMHAPYITANPFLKHASGDGNAGLLVGWSTTLVQTEISQQLLDGLP